MRRLVCCFLSPPYNVYVIELYGKSRGNNCTMLTGELNDQRMTTSFSAQISIFIMSRLQLL